MASSAAMAQTFCNPLDLPYRYSLDGGYREAADPSLINYRGVYYLFASKCGAYFRSDDLTHWTPIESNLPVEGYAPTVEEMNGRLYFTHSVGTTDIYVTDDPSTGVWTKVDGGGTSSALADPMLLHTNGRMYLYWGSSGDPTSWLCGQEIDTSTLRPTGDEVKLFRCSKETLGWEVPGDNNENKAANPWLEGLWVTEHNGKYYLQYSSPGTEVKSYCDAVYTSDAPLGPYTVARHNPFCYRPDGFIAAAGHGSTFQDHYGNWWHISTGTISKRHMFERRLVLYPVFFDSDGEMWAYTGFGDSPMKMPQKKISGPEELETGWMTLSAGKAVKARSTAAGAQASYATDEDIRTWWAANTAVKGEWIRVDLGAKCEIHALQINMADEGSAIKGKPDDVYQYRVEVSDDCASWKTICDLSEAADNAPHRYIKLDEAVNARYVRLYNVHTPDGKFSVSGLRVFGLNTNIEKPAKAHFTSVLRDSTDRRTVTLKWDKADNATGYNIRYGYAPDKLYLNYQAKSATSLTINSLSADEPAYYFTIDTYNDAGITRGTDIYSTDGSHQDTGIKAVKDSQRKAVKGTYDLAGRLYRQADADSLPHGIYIVDGKKTLR